MTMQTCRATDWPFGPLMPDDLPAGIYWVSYRTWVRKSYFGQSKIRLDFKIVEPAAYAGLLVPLFATCKADPNRRSSRDSKYYQIWVRANGGPPVRGQRMMPSVFRGYWRVRIEWGRHKETGALTTPIVAELLERIAGGRE
jgi:hypothetical protein